MKNTAELRDELERNETNATMCATNAMYQEHKEDGSAALYAYSATKLWMRQQEILRILA